MLGSQGIQPVTLVFNNSKNCFLQLSSNFATHLCLHWGLYTDSCFIIYACQLLVYHCTVWFSSIKCKVLKVLNHATLMWCQNQILELSWGVSAPVFLSWIRSRSSGPEDRVEISRQLGEKLGLKEGEQVCHYNQLKSMETKTVLLPTFFRISSFFSRLLKKIKNKTKHPLKWTY